MDQISRYHVTAGPVQEWQPGSRRRVLRNLLGITHKRQMDQAEYNALLKAQTRYLRLISADTRFTAKLLQQMHRDWLGKIYPWAGQHRTVELSKGGFRWPPARRVGRNMAAYSRGTLRLYTPCPPQRLAEVARRLAIVHAELLLIHPFRDGNGRLGRWLADLMALQAGLPAPAYGFVGHGARRQRERYLVAVQQGYLADYDLLADFFREALERALAAGR